MRTELELPIPRALVRDADRPSPDAPARAPRGAAPLADVATFSRAVDALDLGTAIDTLVAGLPVGVLVADADGHVAYANAAARRLDAAALEPLRWAITRALLTEDAVRETAVAVRAPDQSCRWLDVDAVPMRDTRDGIAGALVTVVDATAGRRVAEWEPLVESLMNL